MDEGIIRTLENKCRRCYNCVRYCPAKAIKVEKGQAVVLNDRCIGCGNCFTVCTQNAKGILSGVEHVRELLKSDRRVIACLAPSFPAEMDDNFTPGQLVAAYKKIGFYKVVEVAFGADLVGREYRRIYDETGIPQITTSCPAVIYYVEKYHPQLIPYLTPVVSPMIATALAVRKEYGRDVAVVFIGPCISKKMEARDPNVTGIIDEVLTFKESRLLRAILNVKIEDMVPESFDPPHPSWGRAFPITGGVLKSAELQDDVLDYKIQVVDGREHFIDFINEFQSGRTTCKFAEILFCEGCINGPMISDSGGPNGRKRKVADYIRDAQRAFNLEEWQYYMKKYSDLDLSRSFMPDFVDVKEPTTEEIEEVLRATNKFTPFDELNCKACGYESCRALAKAVCEGIAEKEMCLNYTIEHLENTLVELNHSHQELQTTQNQLINTEKQASLGQLAAGVAHEVNNPLGTIVLYADILLNENHLDDQTKKDLNLIAKEAQRCKTIVSGLLDFSRQREVFTRKAEINTILAETVELIKTQKHRDRIDYVLELNPFVPVVEIDPEQMKQVIVNLINNAIEAMGEEGIITVKSEYLEDKDSVRFSVGDSGPGIPEENIKKLFTPFFTTKQIGQGTGLGLAICYGIIKMHRGDIKVETELGKGTSFVITFPRVHDLGGRSDILGKSGNVGKLAVGFQPRRFNLSGNGVK
jgi:iron only hydrogenase large subunit-like protein/nitrogen-specific signal transduction histidine kinase